MLTRHFPDAPVYSLAGAAAFINEKGEYLLTNIVRKNYGDLAASRVVASTKVLTPGKTTSVHEPSWYGTSHSRCPASRAQASEW